MSRPPLSVADLDARVRDGSVDTVLVAIDRHAGAAPGQALPRRSTSSTTSSSTGSKRATTCSASTSTWTRSRATRLRVVGARLRRLRPRPDLATLRLIPWHDGTALRPVRDLHATTARRWRRRPGRCCGASSSASRNGAWPPMVGTELEFIVFRDTYEEAWTHALPRPHAANQYNVDYSLLGDGRVEPLLRRIRNEMAGAGMDVESAKGECNLGQHEISLPLRRRARPRATTTRSTRPGQEIAAQEGVQPHVHGEVQRARGQLVPHPPQLRAPRSGERPVRPAGAATAAVDDGALPRRTARVPARAHPAASRPTSTRTSATSRTRSRRPRSAWGLDNRTCALRVVGHGPSLRIEHRVPGGDVNPYLAVAALIAAGLHGVEHELPLEPPCTATRTSGRPLACRRRCATRPSCGDASAVARRRVRRRRRRPLRQHGQRGARRVRRRRHRLGALPGVRATVSRSLDGKVAVITGRAAAASGSPPRAGSRPTARGSCAPTSTTGQRPRRGRRGRRPVRPGRRDDPRPTSSAMFADGGRARSAASTSSFHNAGISPTDDDSILDTRSTSGAACRRSTSRRCTCAAAHVIPHMQAEGGGSIINTASFVAVMGAATSQVSYTASKGGVLAMYPRARRAVRTARASGSTRCAPAR